MTVTSSPSPASAARRWPARLRRIALRMACWWGFLALVLAGLILFGTRPPPPPMPAISAVASAGERRAPLAPIEYFRARDGARLAYRTYPAAGRDAPVVAVLIHGSGGSSADMNLLGLALARTGTPAIAPDIRGQGFSGRRGDIDYIGQQEDDLADLVAVIRRDYPASRPVLIGHSSGGGFALRVAGGPTGRLFSRFVLLSPNLGHTAVTTRPGAGGWVSVYTPRLIGLSILNRLGVKAFNGLPVLAFAIPEHSRGSPTTRYWSYRMMANFGPRDEVSPKTVAYRGDAARAPGPVVVLTGSKDEIFYGDRYVAAFAGVTPTVDVRLLDGVSHMGLVSDPVALTAVSEAVRATAPRGDPGRR